MSVTEARAPEAADHRPAAIVGRVARGSVWTASGYVLSAGAGLGASIIVARRLGPSDFGSYSYFMWVLRYAAIFGAFGIPHAMSRFASGALGADDPDGARGIYRMGLRVQAVLTPVVFAAVALFVWLKTEDALLAFVLGAAGALLTGLQSIEGALMGLRRFSLTARNAAYAAAVQVALVAVGAWTGIGWRGFLLLQGVVVFLAVGMWWASGHAAVREWRPRVIDRETRRQFLRFAGMMGIIALSDSILWGRPELFFVERWRGPAAVGLYSAALTMASLTSSLPLVASRVFLPEFSWLLGGNRREELRRAFPLMCRVTGAVAIPLGMGGAILSADLLRTSYGGSFVSAAAAASIVMVGSIFIAIAGPASAGTVTGPRPVVMVKIAAGFAAVNLLLDLILIRPFGIVGAAAASTASQMISVLVVIRYVRRTLGLVYPWGNLGKLLVAAVAAAATAKLVALPFSGAAALGVAAPVGGTIYALGVRLLGALSWAEVRAIVGRPRSAPEGATP
jgi:O-antigen/teichoic acid export membrane protein